MGEETRAAGHQWPHEFISDAGSTRAAIGGHIGAWLRPATCVSSPLIVFTFPFTDSTGTQKMQCHPMLPILLCDKTHFK